MNNHPIKLQTYKYHLKLFNIIKDFIYFDTFYSILMKKCIN
jgi:hypothetical protein